MKNDPTNAAATSHNRDAWNRLAQKKKRFTRAAKDDEFSNPMKTLDGDGWLGGSIANKKLLCLAGGGGRQGPLYAAAGASVTVVDISPDQLELDRVVAAERGLDIRTVNTSMDDLSMFDAGEFEIVIHRSVVATFLICARCISKSPRSRQPEVSTSVNTNNPQAYKPK